MNPPPKDGPPLAAGEGRGRSALILFLLALLTAGSAWSATTIETQVDFVDTVPEHPGLEPYRALLTELDGVRFLAVYQAHDPRSDTDSLRGEAFDALVEEQVAFSTELRQAFPTDFGHELSVQEAMKQGHYMFQKIATGGNPQEDAYSIPDDPVTYDTVKQQLLSDDTLDDVLARNGTSAVSLFFIETRDDGAARALVMDVATWLEDWSDTRANHPVTKGHQPSGLVWAGAYTDAINQQDMRVWAVAAAVGVAVSLLWVVRGPINAAIAVASLAVALTWTFGFMGALGIRISFLTVFLAPVVVGIGIDYAVHILHRYEQQRSRGDARLRALRHAVRRTGRAVGVAAITTIAALLVMGTVSAPLFAQIGQVAALGVFMGLVASIVLVPALRDILPDVRTKHRTDHVGPAVARMARVPWWASLLLVAAVSGVAAWGAIGYTTIESGSSENEFPQDDPVILLQHRIEEEYGAFQRAYIVVQGDMARADALQGLHEAVQSAKQVPLARNATAVTDLLLADEATDEGSVDIVQGILQESTGQAPSDQERLPQTDAEARQALRDLHADPLWRTLAPFTISPHFDLAVVAITIDPWEDQAELVELRDALSVEADVLQQQLGAEYQVAAAGSHMNRAAIIESTPDDVRWVIVGTAGVVFVVLTAAWIRRPGGPLVAFAGTMVVLLAALWLLAAIPALDALYGAAGTANNAALNLMFLLAFAVTVGIGVDDLVHVAERTWESGSVEEGLRRSGRAITGTTVTTFVAFAIMGGVYFLQSKNLAILTALGVLFAYALTLLLAPVALRFAVRK